MTTLDLTADIIDMRDVIGRFEALETELQTEDLMYTEDGSTPDEAREELQLLGDILGELRSYGGDEQWRGDWYPITLIRDSYFTEYCEELVKDCDGLPRDIPSYIAIDWEATAENLKVDYSTIEILNTEYFYR